MGDLIELLRKRAADHGGDKLLTEAAAALEAAREDAWQPIETAPRKGSFFVFGGMWVGESDDGQNETYSGVAMVNRNGRPRFYIANADEFWPWIEGPTHWRPLPAPPAIDQARGKAGQETKE